MNLTIPSHPNTEVGPTTGGSAAWQSAVSAGWQPAGCHADGSAGVSVKRPQAANLRHSRLPACATGRGGTPNSDLEILRARPAGLPVPHPSSRRAFTLVEMLVVIGIIGLLAAMIMSGLSVGAKRRDTSRVEAELRKLELLINNYKDKWGSYPPDNAAGAVTNALYYELSGTTLAAGNYQTLDGAETISSADAQAFLGVPGFLNSALGAVQAKNYLPELKPDHSALISTAPDVRVLTAPGKPAPGNTIIVGGKPVNPWRYVSSNPIHNPGRFDLWAEIEISSKTNIIGNWKN